MLVLELHFNPRPKNEIADKAFDSFCYTPESIYERRMGSLYAIGELSNLLPQNFHLIKNLSRIIKGKYYAAPLQRPEKAIESCLKAANEFLSSEVSKENVSWLGNLNFSALTLTPHHFLAKGGGKIKVLLPRKRKLQTEPHKNWWEVNFTRVGNLKILLQRAGKITDIGKNLDFEEIEPYPLKIFTKTVSGKVFFGDKIIIITKEVFDFFSSQNILNEFAKIESFDEKKIREVLKLKEKEISKISGALLLIDLTKEPSERPKIVTFKKELEKFSMKDAFLPLIKTARGVGLAVKKFLDKILSFLERIFHFSKLFSKLKIKFLPLETAKKKGKEKTEKSLTGLKEKLGPLKFFKEKVGKAKRNLISILLLFLVLGAGFFIFQREEKEKLKEKETVLAEVQEKILEAENFLIFKEEKKANALLKEAWQKILPLASKEGPQKGKAISLKESIEANLKNLSGLTKISEPKIIFEFEPKEFIPQKMTYFKENLYLFSPLSGKLFKINPQTKSQNSYSFPDENGEANLAAVSDKALLFFSKPDKIVVFSEGKFAESLPLKPPYQDFNFISFSLHQNNLYFLDSEKGEIIKYPLPISKGKDSPQLWLNPQTKKAADSKSMAIDGSVWILREDNAVLKYHNGQYQEDLTLDFFPLPKKLYKIFTLPHLPYLYLLEPTQNRLIILEKSALASSRQAGEVFKQFQSEKFENLKDFTVSENGKTIYLLSGQKIYQLEL